MTRTRSLAPFLLLALGVAPSASTNDHWPAWRGPTADGRSSAEGLPTHWGPEENVLWRTELPSWSGATPIVWGERVFVMSPSTPVEGEPVPASRSSRRGSGRHPGGQTLLLLALDANDGSLLWERELDEGNRLWRKSNETSPSPVTDGTTVWATTGTGVIAAFDFDGERLWDRSLQADYGRFGLNWGYASSPLLVDGALVHEVLHGSHTDDASYVVAIDGATGETRWRVERPTDAPREAPDAYTTPLLVELHGQRQIVITGADYATGHDLASGAELWRVAGLNPRRAPNYRVVASPLLVEDLLVVPSRVRPLTAIALDEELRPTAEHVAWQYEGRGGPDVPTPTTDGERLYLVDDGGFVTCLDPGLGEVLWGPERTVSGTVSASPVCADGKLYVTNEEGVTVVLRAGERFELLATNELGGEYTLSSLAVAGGRIYLRTELALYCIAAEG